MGEEDGLEGPAAPMAFDPTGTNAMAGLAASAVGSVSQSLHAKHSVKGKGGGKGGGYEAGGRGPPRGALWRGRLLGTASQRLHATRYTFPSR